VTKIL